MIQLPVGTINFSIHRSVHTGSRDNTASCPMGTGRAFAGGKETGRKADHSPPSSVEVKMTGVTPPLSCMPA